MDSNDQYELRIFGATKRGAISWCLIYPSGMQISGDSKHQCYGIFHEIAHRLGSLEGTIQITRNELSRVYSTSDLQTLHTQIELADTFRRAGEKDTLLCVEETANQMSFGVGRIDFLQEFAPRPQMAS